MEGNLQWKTTFHERRPPTEDNLQQKNTFGGRQPLPEDKLVRKMAFDRKLCFLGRECWCNIWAFPSHKMVIPEGSKNHPQGEWTFVSDKRSELLIKKELQNRYIKSMWHSQLSNISQKWLRLTFLVMGVLTRFCMFFFFILLPHSAPSWILSKAENLASSILQDGAMEWHYS